MGFDWKNSRISGWLLMFVIALIAFYISKAITIQGKHPVESVLLAIILGILLRNLINLPGVFESGIKAFQKILIWGIICLGIRLSFLQVVSIGAQALLILLISMTAAAILIYLVSKFLRLPQKLALLIGVGTTICGGTAIAITAPAIEAEEDDISYAIGTIAIFGLAAMFLYPFIAKLVSLQDNMFGIWAGTAIHSTPQVLAAGFMYSEEAGEVCTIVKLMRNAFMAPAAFLLAIWYTRSKAAGNEISDRVKKINYMKAVPWFILGFIGMAILRTVGDKFQLIPQVQWEWFVKNLTFVAKFLILIAMAGIGLNTKFNAINRIGLKPFYAGFLASVILAGLSFTVIWLFIK